MQVIYAHEQAPHELMSSIFLAGPTPRGPEAPSWRPEALRLLAERGYAGVVFVPEPRDGKWERDYDGQVAWEEAHLHMADVILFWVPRDMKHMPGLTTNDEWGTFKASGKVVFGAPPGAEKTRYQRLYAGKLHIPSAESLAETVDLALGQVGPGARRVAGERSVPLAVWRTPTFQAWYTALRDAGNRLDGARLEWICRSGPGRRWLFLWALRVNVHVTREARNKTSEVVIGRPDVAAVLMYHRGADLLSTRIVVVREFRSAARNSTGMVLELPSGSSADESLPQPQVAAAEAHEETGLRIDADRLRPVASRQIAATLLGHQAHLFAVELTEHELNWIDIHQGEIHGSGPSERTYAQTLRVADLLARDDTDWSTLGMVLAGLA